MHGHFMVCDYVCARHGNSRSVIINKTEPVYVRPTCIAIRQKATVPLEIP